jgi:hypothetical protein
MPEPWPEYRKHAVSQPAHDHVEPNLFSYFLTRIRLERPSVTFIHTKLQPSPRFPKIQLSIIPPNSSKDVFAPFDLSMLLILSLPSWSY